MTMGDIIFNVIWGALVVWSCFAPGGYGPYILLGFNGGDCLVTLYCGLKYGYLKEEDDFQPGRFVTSALGFALLGGFYVGKLSFRPGTDAYIYSAYLIFASFWLTFGYRLCQYGLPHVLHPSFSSPTNEKYMILTAEALLEQREKKQDPEEPVLPEIADDEEAAE